MNSFISERNSQFWAKFMSENLIKEIIQLDLPKIGLYRNDNSLFTQYKRISRSFLCSISRSANLV